MERHSRSTGRRGGVCTPAIYTCRRQCPEPHQRQQALGPRERLSRQPHMRTIEDFQGLTTNYLDDRASPKSSCSPRKTTVATLLAAFLMSPLLSPLSYGPETGWL